LDVVEGVEKDVQLTIPPGEPLLLEPFPVQLPLEPRTNPKPGAIARIGVVSLATGVKPVLEGIDRRDVAQRYQDVLEMLESRRAGFVPVEKPGGGEQMGRGQKLHGHRSQLCRFGTGVALPDERLMMRGKRVE